MKTISDYIKIKEEGGFEMYSRSSLVDAIDDILENMDKDAKRYRWLRAQYGKGEETYLAESISSEDQLDSYIDDEI